MEAVRRILVYDQIKAGSDRRVLISELQVETAGGTVRMLKEELNSLPADTFGQLQCVGEMYSNECVREANSVKSPIILC